MTQPLSANVAVVVIGRNEGERLKRCLSLLTGLAPLVYVDSGSEDESVGFARAIGAHVIELSPDAPFTAARARNEGWKYIARSWHSIDLVQFVDGDCEVAPAWLERGQSALATRQDAAVVCGRLRERHPEASIYNRLCDIEWDQPPGEIAHCGGNAMMRLSALRDLGGFDPSLICGEEVELCRGLRARGWKVLRVDEEMANHDAAMTRFSEWWRRTVRSGYGYAEHAWRSRHSADRYGLGRCVSIWMWAGVVPVTILSAAAVTGPGGLLLAGFYPAVLARSCMHLRRMGRSRRDALLCASFWLLGKFPQLVGQIRFIVVRLRRKSPTLIEYKTPHGHGVR